MSEAPQPDEQPNEEPTQPQEPDEGAEEEEAGEETHDEDGTEGELPPQPEGLSEKEVEKRNQALDKEAIRHANRVRDIVGDDAEALIPCELCLPIVPGFRFEYIPDEQRAAVMLAIGMASDADYLQAPGTERCPDCNGKGKGKTTSQVPGQEFVVCLNCKGRGWIGERANALEPQVPAIAPVANGETVTAPIPASPEVEEAKRAAMAAGLIVIDPHQPATT